MKKLRLLFVIVLVCFSTKISLVHAQAINSKIVTVFVFSFAKYTQWPPQANSGNFVIGVLGKTEVSAELHQLAATRKLGSRQIEIKEITDANPLDAIKGCHMLFVSERESRSLKALASQLDQSSILMISNGLGSVKQNGSMIHIFLDEETDRVRFELNRELMAKANLKPSAQLTSMADVK